MKPIIQKFHNERIDLAEASSFNKHDTRNLDENNAISCIKNYFSNPKAVDTETYHLISNQMINIFKNCPALIHQNNFSATIRLYGYDILLNVFHVKHGGDTTPTEFINADSGAKMSDEEQKSFLSNFEGDHDKQVLRTTKKQMYSLLTKHIESIRKPPSMNLSKHELAALETNFEDPCCFIDSELEQTLLSLIRKVGEHCSRLVYKKGEFKVSIGKPVQVNSAVDELKQNEPTVSDAPRVTPYIEDLGIDDTPVVEAPGIDGTPVVEAPGIDDTPVVEAPGIDDTPVVEDPGIDDTPVVEDPGIDDTPVVEAPGIDDTPVVEEVQQKGHAVSD